MKSKKNVLFIALVLILLSMTIGFAIVSTNLNIGGDILVRSQTWDIYFENVRMTDTSIKADTLYLDNSNPTQVNYSINISYGEKFEFLVDANNNGTLTALIGTISNDLSNYSDNLSYTITYLNGSDVAIDQPLYKDNLETYKVTIMYNGIDSGNLNISSNFNINYVYGKIELSTANFFLVGTCYDIDNQPLTGGKVIVDNIEYIIENDGSYIARDIIAGEHIVEIVDSNGNLLKSDTFSISSGDSNSIINNNIITSSYYGTIANVFVTDNEVILSSSNPIYKINVDIVGGEETNNIVNVELRKNATLNILPIAGYIYESLSCTNNQDIIYDANTNTLIMTNITSNSSCSITFISSNACEYEVGETWEYYHTGDIQEFKASCPGTYKLEVYGAQGGKYINDGGKGGYATGNIVLNESEILYIGVGGSGSNGSYNGGGVMTGKYSSSGGGATHIAKTTNRGILANYSDYRDEVLIVAGGGGGGGDYGAGGTGGGTSGGNGAGGSYRGAGGTQTSGYAFGSAQNTSSNNYSGGGGGWYSGYRGKHNSDDNDDTGGGGGGSGYIGGVQDGSMTNGQRSGDGYVLITYISEN